jgi:large-conductance mechanosensitive channel
MLTALLSFLLLALGIVLVILSSPRTQRNDDQVPHDFSAASMDRNIELFDQIKAARARGEAVSLPDEI